MTKCVANGSVTSSFPIEGQLEAEMQKFFDLLKSAKSVLISSTLTSDGDSIGSQVAVYHLIRALNPEAASKTHIVNQSPVPKRYQFLSDTQRIWTLEQWQEKAVSEPEYDLGITCDGGVERTGNVAKLFDGCRARVLIDHHAVGSKLTYDASILDKKSSSTCELVYQLFEKAGVPVSKEVAEHLYVGIVFDTGFFKHNLTTPRTHHVAAELVKTGIDFSSISDQALLERSWGGQELLVCLMQNLRKTDSGEIVYSFWSHEDLQKISFEDGDQEGMINQLYYTRGAEAVMLFMETDPGQIKVSFRSKGKVNVAEFARSLNPQGGGHIRAAGCSLEGDLQEICKDVVARLAKLL